MFKAKLRKIGNSLGILIPREVITLYKEGDEIELEVITYRATEGRVITNKPGQVITKQEQVITPIKDKHAGKKLVMNMDTGVNEWK